MGPHLNCLWNDAYSLSIGPERHPITLGLRGREVWDEIWDIIGPQIEQMHDFYNGLHVDDREHVSAAFASAADPNVQRSTMSSTEP